MFCFIKFCFYTISFYRLITDLRAVYHGNTLLLFLVFIYVHFFVLILATATHCSNSVETFSELENHRL